MMRFILLLSFMFFSSILLSQVDNSHAEKIFWHYNLFNDSTPGKRLVTVYSDNQINSNALTNSFFNKILYGGEINEELKDQISERLKDNNKAGVDFEAGIHGNFFNDEMLFEAGITHREFFSANFNKNVFELIFRGNKTFADQNISLAPSGFTYYDYQKFHIGIGKLTGKNKRLLAGGGIYFIRGGSFQELEVERANLFTEKNGAYVDLETKFSLLFSDKDNRLIPHSSGSGSGIYLYALKNLGRHGILDFQIKDLGFIRWKGLNQFQADSSYHYEGEEIENIFALQSGFTNSLDADTLAKNFSISRIRKNQTFYLPFSFQAFYTRNLTESIGIQVGTKIFGKMNLFPRIYVSPNIKLKSWIIAPSFVYGGYGKSDLEVRVSKSFKRFFATANFLMLENLLFPSSTSGQGFNFAISYSF